MNWKNLKSNPPTRECDLLCRIDQGGYTETFVARYAKGCYTRVNCYGAAEGRTVHHGDASDMFNYIIIDDIL